MASSSSGPKSSRRHRERIVGSSRPGAWLTRKNSVLAGGSSSILSSAFAPDCFEFVDAVDHHHAPRRQRRRQAMNSPSSRTWSTVMLRARSLALLVHQPLEPAHVGMASRFDQLDHRMIVGVSRPRQVERRPGRIGEHAPRGGVREARLADALGPGEQPCVVQLARRPCAARTARPLDPGRQSRQQVRDGVEQRSVTSLWRSGCVDQAHPLGLFRGDHAERGFDLAVIIVATGRRCGRCPASRARGRSAPSSRTAPGSDRESSRRCRTR